MERSTLRRRVLIWFTGSFIAVLTLVGFLVQYGMRDLLVDQLAESLEEKARSVALDIGADDLQGHVADEGEALDARVTIIRLDGAVIADSEGRVEEMDDHSSRPEVLEAMSGEVGFSRRFSFTTDSTRMYVALPPIDGLIVRLSVTEAQIADELGVLSGRIVSTLVIVGLVGLAVAVVATGRLVAPVSRLTEDASAVAEGNLDVKVRRSSVAELDRLGVAVARMAEELGRQIGEIDGERQTLDHALRTLPQAVVLVEADDSVSYANQATEFMLGLVPDQLSGLMPTSLQSLVRNSRGSETVESVDIEHGTPTRFLHAEASPSDEGAGRVLLMVEDNTDRERTSAMRRDFVADASHELKTPVAAILASMETLEMALERDSDRAIGFLRQLDDSAHRLEQIVEDLLDLSRLEAAEFETEVLDLGEVVADEVSRLGGAAADADVTLTVDVVVSQVRGARSDLGLAVRNLCENAIRYTEPGGAVKVALTNDTRRVTLEVTDTGAGIPTRALPRVFERFFRVDVARSRATGGTGLGLAIVKHVTERHGGAVTVVSELGVGSTFTLTLPGAVVIPEDALHEA